MERPSFKLTTRLFSSSFHVISLCCSIPIKGKKKLKEYTLSIKTWVNCFITYSLYRFVPLKLEIVVNTVFAKQANAVTLDVLSNV